MMRALRAILAGLAFAGPTAIYMLVQVAMG
jgi:hypothetical protein